MRIVPSPSSPEKLCNLSSNSTSTRRTMSSIIDCHFGKNKESEKLHGKALTGKERKHSSFGSDKNHCLCTVLKPLLRMSQLFGMFPVSHNKDQCNLKHFWLSFPAFINYAWIIFMTGFSTWLFKRLKDVAMIVATGTDFYTIVAMFLFNVLTSLCVYISGSLAATMFSEGWEKLHATVEELALPNYHFVKRVIILIPILLLEEFLIDTTLMLFSYQNDELNIEHSALIIAGTNFVSNFVPNIVCLAYSIFAWMIAVNFTAINQQVEIVLKGATTFTIVDIIDSSIRNEDGCVSSHDSSGIMDGNYVRVAKLSRLRMMHENLCAVVRCLEKAFGVQLLVVFSCTGLTFVGGIYTVIIIANGLLHSTRLIKLSIAYSISSVLSGLRLLMVLVISQYLVNKANNTGNILNAYDLDFCNKDFKRQAELFRTKVGSFPLTISCCNIFNLGTSILASASGNIVTYVLVLMQFKLNSKSGSGQQQQEIANVQCSSNITCK